MKKQRYCVFADQLYLGTRVQNPEEIRRKLSQGAGQISVYLVAEAPENRSALAVIHAGFLTQSYYADHPLKVYGIAKGYSEAQELIVRISDEACAAGYPGRLKEYLDGRFFPEREESS